MNTLIEYAISKQMSVLDFGRMLTGPSHDMTAAEATQLMDEYKKHYPKVVRAMKRAAAPLAARKEKRRSATNRSAVKVLALGFSKTERAGHFERVAGSFLDSVEADLQAVIRESGRGQTETTHTGLVTGFAVNQAKEMLNRAVVAIVRGKVRRHPTVGITLKG